MFKSLKLKLYQIKTVSNTKVVIVLYYDARVIQFIQRKVLHHVFLITLCFLPSSFLLCIQKIIKFKSFEWKIMSNLPRQDNSYSYL